MRSAGWVAKFFCGAGGEIGRHARFRILCRKVCGFESRPAHHLEDDGVFNTDSTMRAHVRVALQSRL